MAVGDRRLGILSGLGAVAIISTNPVAARVAAENSHFFTISIGLTIVSVVILAIMVAFTSEQFFMIKKDGVKYIITAGVFKAFNDILYYFAVSTGPTIETNIISYLWPISCIVLGGFVLSDSWKVYRLSHWTLITTCFFGAVALVLGSEGVDGFSGSPVQYLAAFGSAICGIYIVYVLKTSEYIEGTDISKSINCIFFCQVISLFTMIMMTPLLYNEEKLNTNDLLPILYLGIVVIAAFEVLWAFSGLLYKSLSFQSIAYFSPMFSAIILTVMNLDNITPISLLGMAAVICGNTLLHMQRAFSISITLFLLSIFSVVFLRQQFAVAKMVSPPAVFVELCAILFGILVAFAMQRLYQRNTELSNLIIQLDREIYEISQSKAGARWARVFSCRMLSFFFGSRQYDVERISSKILFLLKMKAASSRGKDIVWLVSRIIYQKNSGLYKGEFMVLTILSISIIYFLCFFNTTSPFQEIFASVIAATIIYVLALLKEIEWGTNGLSVSSLASLQLRNYLREGVLHFPKTLEYRTAIPIAASHSVVLRREGSRELEKLRPRDLRGSYVAGGVIAFGTALALVYLTAQSCRDGAGSFCGVFSTLGIVIESPVPAR